jgi:serine/threonine protein kinase
VLIDHNGKPRLTDFGLSRMQEEASLWQTSATSAPGTVRYMAPELLNATASGSSKESDVYAYSMTSWVHLPLIRLGRHSNKHIGNCDRAYSF